MATDAGRSFLLVPHDSAPAQNCEPNHPPGPGEEKPQKESWADEWSATTEGRGPSGHDQEAQEAKLRPAEVL